MTQSSRIHLPVCLILLALCSAPAQADDGDKKGLVLEAGQWVFDVKIQMPMQTEPTTQVLQSCMTSEPITAETLMPWAEETGCKINGVKVKDDTLTWKLRCKLNDQRSRGKGEFSAKGRSGKGKARVNFEAGGRRMAIVTKWEARRVGDCPDAATTGPEPESEMEAEQ